MRPRARVLAFLLALGAVLVALSPPRMVGDAGEYVMMALNLGRGDAPSLSPADLEQAARRYPGDISSRLDIPELAGNDGRQDLPHFWFYPLLAAPFVRIATGVGADPIRGFAALNLLLLAVATIVVASRLPVASTLLLVAGPILWWLDKAHTEVFTFSLMTIAVALLSVAPWWSAIAFGAAATQNPPLAAAAALAVAYGAATFGPRDRRVWVGAAAGGALAALHPLYYHARLGIWSALQRGVDPHWPGIREVITPAIDPNLGIFVYDFPLTIAAVAAAVLVLSDPRRSPRRLLHGGRGIVLVVGALLLFSFTQTTNVNSGGTPGPSRYGLWLIPLTLPILAAAGDAAWLRALAAISLIWCGARFAPQQAEQYVAPSGLAEFVWTRWPALDNPVAEVFAERAGRREPSPIPPVLAPGSCRKVLFEGSGAAGLVLSQCYVPRSLAIPIVCQPPGVYCYANQRGDGSYDFVPAPSTPHWRTIMARQQEEAMRAGTRLDSGWSYVERADGSPGQPATTWRWMADRADVRFHSQSAMRAQLKIIVRAFKKPRRLRIAIGGAEIAQFVVDESPRWYVTLPFELPAGATVFSLESLDGADRAPGSDERRLGIALFRFEVVSPDR